MKCSNESHVAIKWSIWISQQRLINIFFFLLGTLSELSWSWQWCARLVIVRVSLDSDGCFRDASPLQTVASVSRALCKAEICPYHVDICPLDLLPATCACTTTRFIEYCFSDTYPIHSQLYGRRKSFFDSQHLYNGDIEAKTVQGIFSMRLQHHISSPSIFRHLIWKNWRNKTFQ